VDSGIKLIVGFVALVISIVAWAQFNEEAESISEPSPITQKLFFEGSIGGKYKMNMSFDRKGEDVTGSVVNTGNNLRTLKGTISEDKTFLIHEFNGNKMTGTFEGRILSDGNMRGIWSAPPGGKWFPFYLERKLGIQASVNNKLN